MPVVPEIHFINPFVLVCVKLLPFHHNGRREYVCMRGKSDGSSSRRSLLVSPLFEPPDNIALLTRREWEETGKKETGLIRETTTIEQRAVSRHMLLSVPGPDMDWRTVCTLPLCSKGRYKFLMINNRRPIRSEHQDPQCYNPPLITIKTNSASASVPTVYDFCVKAAHGLATDVLICLSLQQQKTPNKSLPVFKTIASSQIYSRLSAGKENY